jgi:hypothetical protein
MSKSNRIIIALVTFTLISSINTKLSISQSTINIAPTDSIICNGESVNFNSIPCGPYILYDDFNSGGLGVIWSANCNPQFNNPCIYTSSATSVYDGTPYLWIGNSVSFPRAITTVPFAISAACQICFDMVYSIQGNGAPCEGPDLSDEGVHVQYSTNGGATWTDIKYYPPDDTLCVGGGGYDACMTQWNNYCLTIPTLAVGNNTQFRWYQDLTSGNSYDNWGIDNVTIFQADTTNSSSATYNWSDNGVLFSHNQNPVLYYPSAGYHEIIASYNDSNSISFDTVYLNVALAPEINLGNDTIICADQLITLSVPNIYSSYIWSNGQTNYYTTFDSLGIGIGSVNIYVTVTNSSDCSSTDTLIVTFQNCTDISNNESDKNILVYPNPAKNIFTIDFVENYFENSNLIISDISGKVLIQEKISAKRINFNSINFSSGVYFISITNCNTVYRKKLIIE